jgi:hypothetical protein
MSRYTITALDPALTVAIGWDKPLSTFFAIVTDERINEDDDRVLLWIGTDNAEIPRPEDLAASLAPYAVITAEDVATLRADRARDLDSGPTALQRQLLDLTRRQ